MNTILHQFSISDTTLTSRLTEILSDFAHLSEHGNSFTMKSNANVDNIVSAIRDRLFQMDNIKENGKHKWLNIEVRILPT